MTNNTVNNNSLGTETETIPAEKYFVFNETGNILIMWSGQENKNFPVPTNELFSKVVSFYTRMIADISQTINPDTKEPYSIYNYNAISDYITKSKKFNLVTHQDIRFTSTSFGNTYSCELIQYVLGLTANTQSLPFANAMLNSMGAEGLKLGENTSNSDTKVGNIVFVCEYLLGAPIISAVVVYCDAKENKQIFSIGPCNKESSTSTNLAMGKDVYTFTP